MFVLQVWGFNTIYNTVNPGSLQQHKNITVSNLAIFYIFSTTQAYVLVWNIIQ